MALSFPASPTNGQRYTATGRTWVYNSTKTKWEAPVTALVDGNAQTLDGIDSTGFTYSRSRANWNDSTVINNVVGQLGWKNYGNNHTIFDASAGTSPNGGAVNNTNPDVAWSGTYPTLMGWNGANTYGLRVDISRNAENAYTLDGWTGLPGQGQTLYCGHHWRYDIKLLQ